ncbi:MAG: TatD family hydrolase [Bacteroidia bacterium]|jgi:TatD DNase family protein
MKSRDFISLRNTWMQNNILHINIHSHHKPRIAGECCIRNAYTELKPAAINKTTYPISIGLHPWHLSRLSAGSCRAYLARCAPLKMVYAIGETGIDLRIATPVSLQQHYFEIHLQMAEEAGKPLIIHAVRSFNLFTPYLKKTGIPFIFHQFSGNEQEAAMLMKSAAYFSFGKNLFTPKGIEVFGKIPPERLFLETDDAAHLHIGDVYRKAAEIRKIPIEALREQLHLNYKQVFNVPLIC